LDGKASVSKVALPSSVSGDFCHAMRFSANSRGLALCTHNGAFLLLTITSELLGDGDEGGNEKTVWSADVIHALNHRDSVKERDVGGGLNYAVTDISFNADGQYIAVADGAQGVYVYDSDS